jgi:hypothetical protein
MFLVRKNELSKYIYSKISNNYDIFNYDFDLLFYGNNWNDYKINKLIDSINSNSEEYNILKKMHQQKNIEINSDYRSYMYLMSSLRNISKNTRNNDIDLLLLYIMHNTVNLKNVENAMKKIWSFAIFDQISKSFDLTAFKFMHSYIKDKCEKKTDQKGTLDYYSYWDDKALKLSLRERYFICNHKKLFEAQMVQEYCHKNLLLEKYNIHDSLDIEKTRNMVYYIPNDVFCYCIDKLISMKLGFPVLNNMIYYKKIYTFMYQLKDIYDSSILIEINNIYRKIETASSVLHKCENKDIKKIYKDICDGKIRMD